MRRLEPLVMCLAVLAAACGSEVIHGGTTSSGGSTATGGSGAGGGGGTASGVGGIASGVGGSGATASGSGGAAGGDDCPDISCATPCPDDTWPELDGCPSCACAADLELQADTIWCEPWYTTLETTPSLFIGGIDRYVFDFYWVYDKPAWDDEEQFVWVTVQLMKLGLQFEPTEKNVTYFYPADSGNPLEVLQGDYHTWGVIGINEKLDPVSGFLSIRRVGDNFEGFVYLHMAVVGGAWPHTVYASGPFNVPVPTP